jgi:hypothetical protein
MNMYRTTPYRVTPFKCTPYLSVGLDWFVTLPERQKTIG